MSQKNGSPMAVRMKLSSTRNEAVIATDKKKLSDLSMEEVLSIGNREALDVLWFH